MYSEKLESSRREFTKETRRVALKGFPNGTPKDTIKELLKCNKYDFETIHTDKAGETCKVGNGIKLDHMIKGRTHTWLQNFFYNFFSARLKQGDSGSFCKQGRSSAVHRRNSHTRRELGEKNGRCER